MVGEGEGRRKQAPRALPREAGHKQELQVGGPEKHAWNSLLEQTSVHLPAPRLLSEVKAATRISLTRVLRPTS